MNKKLLMAAVGAALAATPMLAAQAATTLYGHMHMSLDSADNGSNSYGYVSSNSSRIGVKGDEDVGSGYKAIYQVESGAFAADSGTGGLGGTLRNTYVGFATSSWGAVKIGRYDTPFKDLGRKLDNFNEEVGDMRNLLSGSGTTQSLYDARVSNMIRYESPDIMGSGVTVNVLHTDNDGTEGPAPQGTGKPLTSLGVNWTSGPIFIGGAWQERKFNEGSSTGPLVTTIQGAGFGTVVAQNDHDEAWRLAGSYNWDAFTFGLLWQQLKDIAGSDLKQDAWAAMASYKMGNNLFKFQYLMADDFSGSTTGTSLGTTSNTGGSLWALGVDHMFSKSTLVYVNYAEANNDDNTAAYSVMSGNGGHGETLLPGGAGNGTNTTAGTGPIVGGDKVKAISAGMIINF